MEPDKIIRKPTGKGVPKPGCSLAEINPEVAARWHPTENGGLTPFDVKPGSGWVVWWLCPEGHAIERAVNKKTKGCPVCSGREKQPLSDTWNLAVVDPETAALWHPTENGDLTPYGVTPGSNQRVWWLCPAGHELERVVKEMRKAKGCPSCSNRHPQPLSDTWNLAVADPFFAARWHPTENGDLTPYGVTPGSKQRVWWLCPAGHASRRVVKDYRKFRGCDRCSDRWPYPASETYNLAVLFPAVADRWHPTENGNLTPYDVTPRSGLRIWWLCPAGHAVHRLVGGYLRSQRCPSCDEEDAAKKTKVAVMATDDKTKVAVVATTFEKPTLAVAFPLIAAQWHPRANYGHTPFNVSVGFRQRVWWRCPGGHEMKRTIESRITSGGCSTCRIGTCTEGDPESLAVVDPDLAARWHQTKNFDLTPHVVTPLFQRRVWWLCPEGHEVRRTIKGWRKGCWICRRDVCRHSDTISLAVVDPELAAQWHPARNGEMTPYDMPPTSGERVWWLCPEGHEIQRGIFQRHMTVGPPSCCGGVEPWRIRAMDHGPSKGLSEVRSSDQAANAEERGAVRGWFAHLKLRQYLRPPPSTPDVS